MITVTNKAQVYLKGCKKDFSKLQWSYNAVTCSIKPNTQKFRVQIKIFACSCEISQQRALTKISNRPWERALKSTSIVNILLSNSKYLFQKVQLKRLPGYNFITIDIPDFETCWLSLTTNASELGADTRLCCYTYQGQSVTGRIFAVNEMR